MRKLKILVVCISAIACLTSCVTTEQLYYWGKETDDGTYKYDEAAYNYYDKQSPEAICELIVTYEQMLTHVGGSRQVPPPGLCAEYGYLLLTPDIEQTFAASAKPKQLKVMTRTDFYQYGIELMNKEVEYYPESAQFIQPLINKAKER